MISGNLANTCTGRCHFENLHLNCALAGPHSWPGKNPAQQYPAAMTSKPHSYFGVQPQPPELSSCNSQSPQPHTRTQQPSWPGCAAVLVANPKQQCAIASRSSSHSPITTVHIGDTLECWLWWLGGIALLSPTGHLLCEATPLRL